jgi:hypothetical protein
MFQYCDRWWLVANRDILMPGELPAGWGLLVPHAGGLRCEREGDRLAPEPLPRQLIATMLRAATHLKSREAIEEERREARRIAQAQEGHELRRAVNERDHAQRLVDDYEAQWREFREKIGEDFQTWMLASPHVRQVAELLITLQNMEDRHLVTGLQNFARRLRGLADQLDEGAKEVEEVADGIG